MPRKAKAKDEPKADEAVKDDKPAVITASLSVTVEELLTLQQVLRTYELRGPVDQLAVIIPKFETLKRKVAVSLSTLQGIGAGK